MVVTDPFVDIPAAIRARWNAQIETGGDGGGAITTRYPNDNRALPAGGLWARLTIREGEREQVDVGAATKRSRTPGVLFVELFDDTKEGTAAVEALSKRVRVAFERLTTGGVTFRTPFLSGGSSGERLGDRFRVMVACPFYADDFQ